MPIKQHIIENEISKIVRIKEIYFYRSELWFPPTTFIYHLNNKTTDTHIID